MYFLIMYLLGKAATGLRTVDKIQLQPTPDQSKYLTDMVGASRFVWNHFLADYFANREEGRPYYGTTGLQGKFEDLLESKEFLQKFPECGLWRSASKVHNEICRYLESDDPETRLPVYQRKKDCNGIFELLDNETDFHIHGQSLEIDGLESTITLAKEVPWGGKVTQVTIRQAPEHWYITGLLDGRPFSG